MTVTHMTMENVEAVIPLTVGSGGRISGLGDFVGKKVIVIVPAEESRAKRGGRH